MLTSNDYDAAITGYELTITHARERIAELTRERDHLRRNNLQTREAAKLKLMKKAPGRKNHISAEGLARIAAAGRKRWAAYRKEKAAAAKKKAA